ncbi:hypothetical protein, partial [Spirosoma sp.]|uniref:hypothetical protein n=1 Tax=Spirosoma sp. TaxID=1899569 RepID=UPI003B3A26A1
MQDKYTLPEVRWQPQKAILLWAFVLSALLLNATLNAQANTFDTRKLPPGIVTNTNTGATFSSIQAAIDAAATLDGHTITVASGTYTENVTVSKSLTITGANVGTAGTAT